MSHLHIIKIEDAQFIFEDDTLSGYALFNELLNNKQSKFCVEQGQVWHCYDFEYGIDIIVDSIQKDLFRDDYVFTCHLKYPHNVSRLHMFAKRHSF